MYRLQSCHPNRNTHKTTSHNRDSHTQTPSLCPAICTSIMVHRRLMELSMLMRVLIDPLLLVLCLLVHHLAVVMDINICPWERLPAVANSMHSRGSYVGTRRFSQHSYNRRRRQDMVQALQVRSDHSDICGRWKWRYFTWLQKPPTDSWILPMKSINCISE